MTPSVVAGRASTRRVVPRAVRPVLAALAVLAGWQVAVVAGDVPAFFLPSPLASGSGVVERAPYLAQQSAVTVFHTATGFALAAAAGIAVAVLLTASEWLRDAILPLLVAVQAVPKVALTPLLLIWLGFGHPPKIALTALLCFFPIVISTLAGLTSTPAELTEMARAYTAPAWQTFVKVRAPWALPQMFAGFKVAGSLALIGAVVAQMSNPDVGLGAVVVRASQVGNTTAVVAAVFCLSAIGICIFYGLTWAERRMLPWARAVTG
jgi:NitT/TauT family transport system permease protein